MASFTLYYSPSACSLSPHIVLREAGLPFDLVRVDIRGKQLADGGDWLAINPKGYVPALRLPNGEMLTEGAVMVQYLADQVPAKQLAPPNGTMARVRLQELLHFIATEIHKGMGPLYKPVVNDEFKAQIKDQILPARLTTLAEGLGDKPFLTGEQFTIADAYAFYALRCWLHHHNQSLERWPTLAAYYGRLAARPSVAAALEAEGIKS